MKYLKVLINYSCTSIVVHKILSTFLILSVFYTGCTLVRSMKDVNQSMETTIIVGRIYDEIPGTGPIIAAACRVNEGIRIEQYTVLHESGEYELAVDQGNYYIFAFRDKNSNLVLDEGEPAGQYGDPEMVSAPAVGVLFDIDIIIPEKSMDICIPYNTDISIKKPLKLYSRQAGAITDLDDERFSAENGKEGFWEPVTFFRSFGGNIYFLEEYNPQKTPILFIHGAGNTPAVWKYFVTHIDTSRFQPWFFYYPTGARINSMAYLLLWKLSNLQAKYQFNKIYITAHSMGGLLARAFIVNYGQKFPVVKLFVSLATPWGGDSMSEYGVQQSPLVIPSWIDMQPEGDFINSLYRTKMDENINFYLFYGFKGDRLSLHTNNDGTIALSSLLDRRAQSEAEMNYAFNEDHSSILSGREVLDQYNTILNAYDQDQNTMIGKNGGFIQVRFSYNYGFNGVRPRPKFILNPEDEKNSEIVTYLSDNDSGRVLGPFPAGNYLASLVSDAGKSGEKYIPVSVKNNKIQDLNFTIQPDGVIRGCVVSSPASGDKFPGMPDIVYRSENNRIIIQSISLEGNGIYRSLPPLTGEEINNNSYLIVRKDFCYNGCFGFFDLPAGDYKVTIKADGFKPMVKTYSVEPGIPKDFRVTELIPE